MLLVLQVVDSDGTGWLSRLEKIKDGLRIMQASLEKRYKIVKSSIHLVVKSSLE